MNITVHWEAIGYDSRAKASVRDLFAAKDLGTFEGELTLVVDLHDARMVKITPEVPEKHHDSWRPWHQDFDSATA